MKKNLINVAAILALTIGSSQSSADESLFEKGSISSEGITTLTDSNLKEVEGKWVWIPVAIASAMGVAYCSHFGFDNRGNKYYHFSCF